MKKKEQKRREKKFERGFYLFFSFSQGLFLAFLIFGGIYEKKLLPAMKERDRQIHLLKSYIQHMQTEHGYSSGVKNGSTEECLVI